jgi:hypothetical protein
LRFAYTAVLENELTDIEAAIQCAAFVLFGPEWDFIAVANEAKKFNRHNSTFSKAIHAATLNRRRRGVYGTYVV